MSFFDQINEITQDKSASIVCCGSSPRSRDGESAAEKLIRAGFTHVRVLEGGQLAWREAGYDLVGDGADLPDEAETQIHLQDGRYSLDPQQSSIEWSGRNRNSTHFGTLQFTKGGLEIINSTLTGTLEVDMNSIENINLAGDELQPVLIAHLKSDDFFDVERFPVAQLSINSGKLTEEPYLTSANCEISATLDLHGVSRELLFNATISPAEDSVLAIEAHFDIDRTRWGIIYGSTRFNEHLGMHTVFDTISIQLRLILHQE